jgi:hypothetical protein
MRRNRNIGVNSQGSPPSDESRISSFVSATPDNVQSSYVSENESIYFENQKNNEKTCADLPSRASDNALAVDESSEKRYYHRITRMWRNWQTHRLQVPAGLTPLEVRLLSSAFFFSGSSGAFCSRQFN